MPHITEEIYQIFFKKFENTISIHLTNILEFKHVFKTNEELIKFGDIVVNIISDTRKFKSEKNISLKVPITKMTVEVSDELLEFINNEQVLTDIKNTSNCKEVAVEKCEKNYRINEIIIED